MLIGESSSCDKHSGLEARVVSGESKESNFLLFAARVLLATGGVAVGACSWGRAWSAVEHVSGGSTAVALVVADWFRFSSHANLLRLFLSCLDLLACFFFTLVSAVSSFSLRAGIRHVKVRISNPPRVSLTIFARTPFSKQCR